MKKIWKETIEVTDNPVLQLPKGAEILSVQVQDGALRLWFFCDPEAPKVPRIFRIFGTGQPIIEEEFLPFNPRHIGTFQLAGGAFVGHLFEYMEVQSE